MQKHALTLATALMGAGLLTACGGSTTSPPAKITYTATLTGANERPTPVTSSATGTWTGVLDRSACGTGTCARMATLHARGKLGLGQPFRHEGILGTVFTGCLVEETVVGPYPAVVPTLTGSAWISGICQYVLDAEDPFPEGFTVGDLWPG